VVKVSEPRDKLPPLTWREFWRTYFADPTRMFLSQNPRTAQCVVFQISLGSTILWFFNQDLFRGLFVFVNFPVPQEAFAFAFLLLTVAHAVAFSGRSHIVKRAIALTHVVWGGFLFCLLVMDDVSMRSANLLYWVYTFSAATTYLQLRFGRASPSWLMGETG
jgi:hypothetical protein